ncbi:putative O-fucosyltransferase, plant [Helianthus annuus]|nr:putative O-fucosyltransferase, plant [Helianthus annuus]KAJ0506848.1 putative O-fucosyltransferase, plant [Helianthus annuus]
MRNSDVFLGAQLELGMSIWYQSDVFVLAISGLFYADVAGKRIGSGKTKIVVPDDSASAGSEPGNYISRYVSKKTHMAYSCFC